MRSLFIELLQITLGARESLSRAPSMSEWQFLLDEAQRQAVAGIMVAGLERLPDKQRPPQAILLQWIGVCQQIEVQNALTTKTCQQLCKQLDSDGLYACVLKGQSNYRYYPTEMKNRRSCGDIDVWVCPKGKGDIHPVKTVLEYVQSNFDMNGLCWLHTSHVDKSGVPVEVHLRASFMSEPCMNRRFQKHFNDVERCRTIANVDGAEIPCMKVDEDVIYQMNHIYRHLIDEGVGLRQIVDYYYLLVNGSRLMDHDFDKRNTMNTVEYLGMKRFAGALMYALQKLLGLSEDYLLCPAVEKDGIFLMKEILISGNFGHGDPRMGDISIKGGYLRNRVSQALRRFKRNMRFLTSYPGEVIWEPIVRIEHFMWKKLRLWRW